MNFKTIIISAIVIVILILGIVIGQSLFLTTDDTRITDDYIVVFHGGASEVTYDTYVYKKGFKYKYISTQSYGMTHQNRETVILNVGKINKFNEIYEIIQNYGADEYATLPNDDRIYQLEEIKEIIK